MFEWLDRVGYHANILTLRHEYLELGWHTFEEWARNRDWSFVGSGSSVTSGMEAP